MRYLLNSLLLVFLSYHGANASTQTVTVNNLSCDSSYVMTVKSLDPSYFNIGGSSNIAGTLKLSSNLSSEYIKFTVNAYVSGYSTAVFSTQDINVCSGGFKALSSTSCPNKGLYYFGTGVNLPSSPITMNNIKLGVTASSSGTQIMDCTFSVNIQSSGYSMTASVVVGVAGFAVLAGAFFIKRRSRKIGVIDDSVLGDFTQMNHDAVSTIECASSSTLNSNSSVIV